MTDLRQLFLQRRPLLDVRAPTEFARGAFPTATNIPILNDEQREQVGTCYKNHGPKAAEALGYELVEADREALIERWKAFFTDHPDALLYCFRGGKRSQIAEQWLLAANVSVQRIQGGYKRLRNHLLQQLEDLPDVILLSGKTGVGKTELLPRIKNAVDLESLANHRGSAFGGFESPQPSQIDFENALAIELMGQPETVVLEDESRLIGRVHLPLSLQSAMKAAPICLLEDSVENRTTRILDEYVRSPLQSRSAEDLMEQLLTSVDAIKNRLGGVRHQEMRSLVTAAFNASSDDLSAHRRWIEKLLVEYYDPMYEYQLSKKQDRIRLRLDWQSLSEDELLDLRTNTS